MSSIKPALQEAVLRARAAVNSAVDRRWDNDPFGDRPHATREEYLQLFEAARRNRSDKIAEIEERVGYAVESDWLDELALHTQIVKKKSELCYDHGRLPYSLLRERIRTLDAGVVSVIETGTARGFSAICMSRAIQDSGVEGRIVSLDVLSHRRRQIWNCIDDLDGPKSRAEILEPWRSLSSRVVFLQSDTSYALPRVSLGRIHFAFLDAQHTRSSVLFEFDVVASQQGPGDSVVFDDVTRSDFPGVVAAVEEIEASRPYRVDYVEVSPRRGYAWATRTS